MEEVIFISNYVGNGGAGRVISVLADYFAEKNIITSIVIYNELGKEYEVNLKVKFHKISRTYPSLLGKIQRIIKLRKYLKKHANSTLIAFEYFVNIEAILAGKGICKKIIVSERNDPKQVERRKITKVVRNMVYKSTDVLVCQTQEIKEYFSEAIQQKTVVIPNPIKSNLPIGTGKNEKEIITFCRITPQKNLKLMIDVFEMFVKDYPEYTLSIYGDGNSKEELIAYCNSKGLSDRVNFYPFMLNVHEQIFESVMFLSTSDYEGLSNSMLEAMAMGIPVICTDCDGGGARMIIKDKENGILVPKGDKRAFYEAMKYLIETPSAKDKIRCNALKIREELSENHVGDMWLKLIFLEKNPIKEA